tara:strand:+ start:59 stop:298 length:240 start_codon:yes stop_codon:yes gene_type:complete
MIDDEVMKALLAHARYSFAEIGWDFEQLTNKEKALIGSQETLDKIRLATEKKRRFKSKQQSVDVFANRTPWNPSDPRNW